jgi:hypothetical protein
MSEPDGRRSATPLHSAGSMSPGEMQADHISLLRLGEPRVSYHACPRGRRERPWYTADLAVEQVRWQVRMDGSVIHCPIPSLVRASLVRRSTKAVLYEGD